MKRLLAILLFLTGVSAIAQDSHVKAKIVADRESIQKGETFHLGIHLQMSDHWHTYWENPGFAGLPTEWTIEEIPGLKIGALGFPLPKKFEDGEGAVTYGYDDETLLIAEAAYTGDAASITIKGVVNWLECKELCIPGKAESSIVLKVGESKPARTELFAKYRALIPKPWSEQSPFTFSAVYAFEEESWNGSVTIMPNNPQFLPESTADITFFPLKNEEAELKKTQIRIEDGQLKLELSYDSWEENLPPDLAIGGVLGVANAAGLQLTKLNLYPNSGRAGSAPLTETPTTPPGETASGLGGFWYFAIFAFIGGLILNLMPCVLPVLSLKVFGLVNEAGESAIRRVQLGWVYTLGIMTTFFVLSLFFALSKAAGEQLGIGFQLGNPLFVVFMIVLLFLMALGFFGVFHFGAPNSQKLNALSQKSGIKGAFFMGALMTVLSTPCTAPFLGAAYGWALSQSIPVILLTFQIIALGLAFPYLFLCYLPGLLKYLPKPGPWMVHFKISMGFLMLGTAIWLITVLSELTGGASVTGTMVFLLLLSQAAYIYGQSAQSAAKIKGYVTALVLVGLGFFIGFNKLWNIQRPFEARDKELQEQRLKTLSQNPSGQEDLFSELEQLETTAKEIAWVPYTTENLAHFREQNRLVFLDFTAAWCLTCKTNENLIIDTKKVRTLFAENKVVTMKGDYTKMKPEHTAFINSFKRAGVPLYVIYPGQGEPLLLPETLTKGIVTNKISEAKSLLEGRSSTK